jgi:hypothetical protein
LEDFININSLHFDSTDTEGVSLSIGETAAITVHLAWSVNHFTIFFTTREEAALTRVKSIATTFRLGRREELGVDMSESIGAFLWDMEAVCLRKGKLLLGAAVINACL